MNNWRNRKLGVRVARLQREERRQRADARRYCPQAQVITVSPPIVEAPKVGWLRRLLGA